jgi:hypothetical protein
MVIIDVFAKVRGQAPPSQQAYDADYAAISRAKRIADDYGIAVVLVHHVRKAGSDDFLAEVSGTNGLAGAADAVLVLKRARGEADGQLHVTGRDIDESEYALKFAADIGTWQMLDGPAHEHFLGDTRALLARFVREHPGQPPRDIAAALQLEAAHVRVTLRRMVDDDQIRASSGHYYPHQHSEQEPETPLELLPP